MLLSQNAQEIVENHIPELRKHTTLDNLGQQLAILANVSTQAHFTTVGKSTVSEIFLLPGCFSTRDRCWPPSGKRPSTRSDWRLCAAAPSSGGGRARPTARWSACSQSTAATPSRRRSCCAAQIVSKHSIYKCYFVKVQTQIQYEQSSHILQTAHSPNQPRTTGMKSKDHCEQVQHISIQQPQLSFFSAVSSFRPR